MSTLNPGAAASTSTATTSPPSTSSFSRVLKNLLPKEAHPMARNPTSQLPHPVAWPFYRAKFGRAAPFYVVGVVLFFGWPFALKGLINLNNGVYDKPTKGQR
ncbi:hypothetical protein DOTSEDRAFT_69202 [Dothistroma septosporum NZE10]|uniref:Uncharacterized protein n=1 Tax=Dothistroma septosporum (strain NZE10 / CBS 128990) TaxID=675120 RepID=N1PY85_DOTSN|nr:hypothetical protein DOTSEDRAFT_69202 [Dothistroma septosporum NZE10]